ncbi:hypothetical protein IAU60_000595 [Kwoniella sp. DSM 27419]
MSPKREHSPISDQVETSPPASEPQTPTKKKSKASPKSSPSARSKAPGELSAKGKYAMMIIDAGIAALSKSAVEAATGLSAQQQNDATRKDKGYLRKRLQAVAESV